MQVTIGCDPEIFLRKQNNFLSAFGGIFKGTKENPEVVQQGAVQVDGMALEFNTNPARTVDEFCYNIKSVLKQIREKLGPDVQFDTACTVHLTQEFLDAQPEEAKLMGCDPDFNAYSMLMNTAPEGKRPMRTAGGHVHIGWGENMDGHNADAALVAKVCDVLLGIPSVLLDTDKERRGMYGQAGAYRTKPYGVEYRTLSNFWVHNEALQRWVFQQANESFASAPQYQAMLDSAGITEQDVQRIINTSDTEGAEHVVQALGIRMPE